MDRPGSISEEQMTPLITGQGNRRKFATDYGPEVSDSEWLTAQLESAARVQERYPTGRWRTIRAWTDTSQNASINPDDPLKLEAGENNDLPIVSLAWVFPVTPEDGVVLGEVDAEGNYASTTTMHDNEEHLPWLPLFQADWEAHGKSGLCTERMAIFEFGWYIDTPTGPISEGEGPAEWRKRYTTTKSEGNLPIDGEISHYPLIKYCQSVGVDFLCAEIRGSKQVKYCKDEYALLQKIGGNTRASGQSFSWPVGYNVDETKDDVVALFPLFHNEEDRIQNGPEDIRTWGLKD